MPVYSKMRCLHLNVFLLLFQSGKDPVTLSMIFYAATDSQGNIIPVTSSSESGKQLTAIYGG